LLFLPVPYCSANVVAFASRSSLHSWAAFFASAATTGPRLAAHASIALAVLFAA
jgi:hypothetical protein